MVNGINYAKRLKSFKRFVFNSNFERHKKAVQKNSTVLGKV
jgi:hypothetical protein